MKQIIKIGGGTTLIVLLQSLLFCLCFSSKIYAQTEDNGTILIVTSYNPDTQKMGTFINAFQTDPLIGKLGFSTIVENLGCRGLDESMDWCQRLDDVLRKYSIKQLKALILLGQEAYISYLNIENPMKGIPFYACYVSENGIYLPNSEVDTAWVPQYMNNIETASIIGLNGGCVNHYDVESNVKLIQMQFPDVEEIALVSDNSYGGVSIQALVKKEMHEKFPNIKLRLLDGRKYSVAQIENEIEKLSNKTVLLLGSWRVDKNGGYFLLPTMKQLIHKRPSIPVFTLTGIGMGSIAIGGYIPNYDDVSPNKIALDIYKFYKNNNHIISMSKSSSKYVFDEDKLRAFGIGAYHLPVGSVIQSNTDERVAKYKGFAIWSSVIVIVLSVFLFVLLYLYHKTTRLKNSLDKREKELIKAKDKAMESDKLKSAFLANMSHEIRTPLNAIVGFSELIMESDDPKEKAEYYNILTTNNELLLRLISDILDLSKIEAGVLHFDRKELDLSILFDNLVSSMKLKVTNPNVELIAENPYSKCLCVLDKNRLAQVITNFVTNAIKHTFKGFIIMGYECVDDGVKIYVKDSGCGIAEEQRNKVFQRFEKLDDFTQGTGLGLSICKAIVTSNGGRIWFDSKVGEGSQFYAILKTQCTFIKKDA